MWALLTLLLWILAIVTAIVGAAVFVSMNGLWVLAVVLFVAGVVAAFRSRRDGAQR